MIKAPRINVNDIIENYPTEVLNIYRDSTIIDKEAAILSWYSTMRLKKIETLHHYQIWFATEENRWKTYIDNDIDGKRRLIARTHKDDLLEVLLEHYDLKEKARRYTLETLFPEWLQFKSYHTRSTATIRHHQYDWHKYYQDTPITRIPISELSKSDLDAWIHSLIKSEQLTDKQYTNIAAIIRQELDYAVDLDIIQVNPFRQVRVQRRLLIHPLKREAETQVYIDNELNLLLEAAWSDFAETADTSSLAIILCAKTGIRIGECMALKPSDLSDGYLHIRREEIINTPLLSDGTFGPREYVVVDHCKTDAGLRDIPAVSDVLDVITAVKKTNIKRGITSEYLFYKRDGSKMHAKSVDRKIRTLCTKLGINPRSAHKLRKTFISALIDAGMNIDTIRRIAGHANEAVTLRNYCFDRRTPDEIREQIEHAL